MAVDVKGTLHNYLTTDGKGINITPAIGTAFGTAIGSAISEVLSGSLQVDGATFGLTGDSVTANVAGTGSAPPLLDSFQVSATFTATTDAVQLALVGTIQSSFLICDAWPAVLNEYPFTALTISSGKAAFDVNPGDETFDFSLTATASLDNTPIGTGLFEAKYDQSLGFLAGFIVTGTWTPFSKWPVLQNLSIQGEGGVFVATIDADDLSDFSSLNLPYLPDTINKGLTFLAFIELGGSLESIEQFLPSGTNLSLLANLPLGGDTTGASVIATLSEPSTNNAFNFKEFQLAWQSTSADSGDIKISVTAVFNIDANDQLDLTGDGTFIYGATPSLDLEITATGQGPWTHPFGIPNLQILSISIGFSISEEGLDVGIGGQIEVGTDPSQKVILEVDTAVLDFEAPSFVKAELSADDKGKMVTLPQLIDDFIPTLDLTSVPLLSQIAFSELMFYAVAAPITIDEQDYLPGIGATGDISFFGYDLDFAFSLTTSPSVAVKAKGTISQGGGPIVINAGGIQLLKLSDATGNAGPSACIDTTASGYCGTTGGANSYFNINASLELLGLVDVSIVAAASESSFEFDLALGASSIFTANLHCELIPDKGDFAASAAMQFLPDDITLGPWGPIPQFTIPTPHIDFCIAFGTIVPTVAPCADGWLPTSAPYFHMDLKFSWGAIDFDLDIDLEMADVISAFNDFESFLKTFILNNAKLVLNFLLATAELLTKALYQIGMAIADIANIIATQFNMLINDAFNLVTDVVDSLLQACGVVSGNNALQPSAMVRRQPQFLVDLTASPKGQDLLYHYYLHRDEVEARVRQAAWRTGKRPLAGLSGIESSEDASERVLPAVIEFVRTVAADGSPELQASAAAVLPELERHRTLTYAEFVAALSS